jgi:hypothetical protein
MSPLERLREFSEAVAELERNRFYPDCLSGILHIGLDLPANPSAIFEMRELDPDALKSFLVTFRKLTVDSEVIALDKVYRDASKVLRGSSVERWLKLSQVRVKYAKEVGWPTIMHRRGGTWQPIELFKIWIYGHPAMFHRYEKRKEPKLWDEMARDANKSAATIAVSLQFIRKMTREMVYLRKLVDRATIPTAS